MELHHLGLAISVEDDGDGFPVVSIETAGGLLDQSGRPVVDVFLNGSHLHRMFGGGDAVRDAAPDLMAALRWIATCGYATEAAVVIDHARRAIAKAEGRGE